MVTNSNWRRSAHDRILGSLENQNLGFENEPGDSLSLRVVV